MYGIIAIQLVLTAAVASVVVFNTGVQHFMLRNVGVQIALLLVSILALIPLYIWRQSHPLNLVLLGLWTSLFSGAGGSALGACCCCLLVWVAAGWVMGVRAELEARQLL